MKKITIIGAGFAALTAIRKLRGQDKSVEITLVAPKAEFHYLPGMIWIPSGLRKREDLIVPLLPFFKRMNVKFYAASVTGLSADARVVFTDQGEVYNDALLIASGGRFIKKLPGIEHSITPCEGLDAAERIRDRLAEMQGGTIAIGFAGNPKEPSAMRGGPMFEFLFGIDSLLRKQGRRGQFKLVFFSPAEKPGNRLGEKAVTGLLKEMKKRDIQTQLGHKMKAFEANKVLTQGAEFEADLILFMPGMTGNLWFDDSELPRSEGGLLIAARNCKIDGLEFAYVAGDSGSYPGPGWMPKQAHMADLQAEAAAKNILAEFKGESPDAEFRVELMCIVDSMNKGMLVMRSEKNTLMLPGMRLFHWAKRALEVWYLKQYR